MVFNLEALCETLEEVSGEAMARVTCEERH